MAIFHTDFRRIPQPLQFFVSCDEASCITQLAADLSAAVSFAFHLI